MAVEFRLVVTLITYDRSFKHSKLTAIGAVISSKNILRSRFFIRAESSIFDAML